MDSKKKKNAMWIMMAWFFSQLQRCSYRARTQAKVHQAVPTGSWSWGWWGGEVAASTSLLNKGSGWLSVPRGFKCWNPFLLSQTCPLCELIPLGDSLLSWMERPSPGGAGLWCGCKGIFTRAHFPPWAVLRGSSSLCLLWTLPDLLLSSSHSLP